jgi:hypothetical protein
MSCQGMAMTERMDIFRLRYAEGLKPSTIARQGHIQLCFFT